ncbi:Cell morphogenesis protein PAG1 [Serendipita sp. 401]|nr:Cell morphogenesis protein PAG1 [Serendipita sp. 401]
MSSEGFQITIPNLDNGDESSALFGKQSGFGGFDSPTPTFGSFSQTDRQNFHTRADSNASGDSAHSFRFGGTSTPTPSFKPSSNAAAHSSSSSVNNFSVPRKPSLASLKNAFRGGGKTDNDPPPVPPIQDSFSFSNKQQSSHDRSRQPSISSMQHGKSFSRTGRPMIKQASQSGPVPFFLSDNGSNGSIGGAPIPRRPVARHRATTSTTTQERGANTPSDYALTVIFHRFVTSAEALIDMFLQRSFDEEPSLPQYLGPDVDKSFDGLLHSLGRIAQRHTNYVIDCIIRWRRMQNDRVPLDSVGSYQPVTAPGRSITGTEAARILGERKALASIYITCRALIVVLESIHTLKNPLDETMGGLLEETVFEQFHRPDLKLLAQSANAQAVSDLYAVLLGHLSHFRFQSVTDRFTAALRPIRDGKVGKDEDGRFETLLKGLRHIQIKVHREEDLEEATDFMSEFAQCFGDAHGLKLKIAFAETLIQLLHPVSKTAQEELNHPQWAKAISIIHKKVKDMLSKPRYWQVAFPLYVTTLCVAPHEFFLQNWMACIDGCIARLKDIRSRPYSLNGILRLVWTYLFRCRESSSTSVEKLEIILRALFPPNRSYIYPPDESLEPFICIVHFTAFRYGDYGRSFILKLLQESSVTSSSYTVHQSEVLAPDRMMIAVKAILYTLTAIEKDSPPSWPTSSDFSSYNYGNDYLFTATFLPDLFYAKPDMQDFHDRYGPVISRIANICGASVGSMFVFEERFNEQAIYASMDDRDQITTRMHGEYTVGFRRDLVPQIDLLRTVFESWPRCLHASMPLADMLDFLIRGVIHVDPAMSQVASAALKRTAQDGRHSKAVMSRFTKFLFSAEHVQKEGAGTHLVVENSTILLLWESVVKEWSKTVTTKPNDDHPEPEVYLEQGVPISVQAVVDSIEAGALFLLTYNQRRIRFVGIRILKLLGRVNQTLDGKDANEDGPDRSSTLAWALNLLQGKDLPEDFLVDNDNALDSRTRDRLAWWRENTAKDKIQRLAEGSDERDQRIWAFVLPAFIRVGLEQQPIVIGLFKDALSSAVQRFQPLIASLAGVSKSAPVTAMRSAVPYRGLGNREVHRERSLEDHKPIIGQWQTWLSMLCATAAVETRVPFVREHTRAHSELQSLRERLYSPKGLFRLVVPYLMSDHGIFRTAVVIALSCIHQSAYKSLLDDLQGITRHIYDDTKNKSIARNSSQDRLHTAVAHVYQLTSHFAKEPKVLDDPVALNLLLGFVKETTAFLRRPKVRHDLEFQRLRRFFCGVVENLCDGLASMGEENAARWLSPYQRLSLYRLCEEWYTFNGGSGRSLRRGPTIDSVDRTQASYGQLTDTELLSSAAAGALAALCRGAFFTDMNASSPADFLEPISVEQVVDHITSMLTSNDRRVMESGSKALRSLLIDQRKHGGLINATLRSSYVTSTDDRSSPAKFFEVLVNVIMNHTIRHFSFEQIVCLGLSNLCQPRVETRRLAFNLLERLHSDFNGTTSLGPFESAVGSLAASVYLPAQRRVSQILAGEHSNMSGPLLNECSLRLPQVYDDPSSQLAIHPHVLRFLEPWVSNIHLMKQNDAEIAWEGQRALYNLLSLTIRYGDLYPDQIQAIWEKLTSHPSTRNDTLTVKFLIEQAAKRGNPTFITSARRVIACLSRTSTGRLMFKELCELIEPESMLPMQERNPSLPNLHDAGFIAELESVFTPENESRERQPLGTGQLALLFMGDIALERGWEVGAQLPVLLHTICVHLDHQSPYVQDQAKNLLFQTLRSLTPGIEDSPIKTFLPSRPEVKATIDTLARDSRMIFWKPDEGGEQVGPKMERLCKDVLSLLIPLYPQLRQDWGDLALDWGSTCPIRSIAFRSLQLFRVLGPQISRTQLATLIGRISNIISESDRNVQAFSREIIVTFASILKTDIDPSLLPPLFWCACACLSTNMELEFLTVLSLVDNLLQRLDLNDNATLDSLLAHRPPQWSGENPNLQSMIIVGLRSSVTFKASYTLLAKLAKVTDAWLVDGSDNRVKELFTLILPFCLHTKDGEDTQVDVIGFANDIGHLAERAKCSNIARLVKSFAKGIVRTREDLLRQGVACIRDDFGPQAVNILLGLMCNSERWLKIKTMEVLKVLFQQPRARIPLASSELLNPLLRLLNTDLAPQALEVLDEPLAIAAGPSPAHAFRMSMAGMDIAQEDSFDGSSQQYYIPASDSGWIISNKEERAEICRTNALAVFDTCRPNNRPSVINFEPETRSHLAATDTAYFSLDDPASLGDLVSTLNDLNNFFQADGTTHAPLQRSRSIRDTQAAHNRAAEILSRSFGRTGGNSRPTISGDEPRSIEGIPTGYPVPLVEQDQPPTPFIGLFSVTAPQPQPQPNEQDIMENLNQNFLRGVDSNDSHESGRELRYRYPSSSGTRLPLRSGNRAPSNGSNTQDVDSGSETDEDPYALDRIPTRPRTLRKPTKQYT